MSLMNPNGGGGASQSFTPSIAAMQQMQQRLDPRWFEGNRKERRAKMKQLKKAVKDYEQQKQRLVAKAAKHPQQQQPKGVHDVEETPAALDESFSLAAQAPEQS